METGDGWGREYEWECPVGSLTANEPGPGPGCVETDKPTYKVRFKIS